MYIGHARLCVCVCLSVLAALPHYCTDPDVTWGTMGCPLRALVGEFAIDARVSLLYDNVAPNTKCQRVLCTIRLTILTCAQKLMSSQLNLPLGTKQKKNNEEIKNKKTEKRRCSEETVRS